jgi:ABC-type spermidine/putrescine transport system permease subunit I
MRPTRGALLLLGAVLAWFALLYVMPIAATLRESFRVFQPSRIGGLSGSWTLANYADLLDPAYAGYFVDTFRISLVATLLGLVMGYPVAFYVARFRGPVRTFWIALLVALLFLGTLVRAYAIALTLGPAGFLLPIAHVLGVSPNSLTMIEIVVVCGLLHMIVPIIALTLVGTVGNVNPQLEQAAQSLGAPRWRAFFEITVALSARGLVSAFLLGFALAISSFVIPLVLGKGIVIFATNLIFARFQDVANYPGGAAIAVTMLVLSFGIVYGVSFMLRRTGNVG